MSKRQPWAARRLFLVGAVCLAASVSAGLIDHAIYPAPGATQMCSILGEDCARAYTYFGFQGVQVFAGLFSVVTLLVATVRAIRTRSV